MKRAVRILLSFVLFAAIAGMAAAAALLPVRATPYRFTATSTKSTVDVILNNHNGGGVGGTLTVYVVRSNGVTIAVTRPNFYIPDGNSSVRVVIPFEISSVRNARVTKLTI